jgi:hypothetical protein
MSPSFAASYARILGLFSILIAVLFALAGVNDFTGANDIFFRLASTGGSGVAGLNTPEADMAMAIAGGVFGGLMAMYAFITAPGLARQDALIRRGSIIVLLTWFAIDSSASVASGNAPNAIINVVFLAIYLLPLLLVRFDPRVRTH